MQPPIIGKAPQYTYSLFGRYSGPESKTFKARVVAASPMHAIEAGLEQIPRQIIPGGYIVALEMGPA
jgi:hypothetical protein